MQRADVEGDGQPFLLVGVDVLVAVAVINGADVDTPGAYVGIATGGDVAAALTVVAAGGNADVAAFTGHTAAAVNEGGAVVVIGGFALANGKA